MPKVLSNQLTAKFVSAAKDAGRYADGGGLYLVVTPSGSKNWMFMFRWGGSPGRPGRQREMGLGPVRDVSLAKARELAEDARRSVRDGVDPIEAKRRAQVVTFGKMADDYIATHRAGWRNEKHAAQWEMTLRDYAAPIRSLPVDAVGVEDVLAILKPLWSTKPETAARLRGRIELVLDAAKAKGLRSGENPAAWRGNLKHLLPKRSKLTRGHHAAMPYADVPTFIERLRASDAVSARGLEFLILTAARSGEVIGARWAEIDRKTKVWTVPAERMKSGREHRVPLTDRALAIIDEMEKAKVGEFIFPGQKRGKPLSSMAFEMLLRRLEVDFTTHGFRSSFRDWAGSATNFPRDLAELALAHAVGDEVERAYRRDDAIEKRRKLMEAWARFVEPKPATNVVALHAAN